MVETAIIIEADCFDNFIQSLHKVNKMRLESFKFCNNKIIFVNECFFSNNLIVNIKASQYLYLSAPSPQILS